MGKSLSKTAEEGLDSPVPHTCPQILKCLTLTHPRHILKGWVSDAPWVYRAHITPYMALCMCTSDLLNSQIYPKLSNAVEISLLKGERVLVQGAAAGWLFRDATKNYLNFAYSLHSSYLSFILFILCSSFLTCFDVAVVHHLPNCSS